jgi:hypothetical protein
LLRAHHKVIENIEEIRKAPESVAHYVNLMEVGESRVLAHSSPGISRHQKMLHLPKELLGYAHQHQRDLPAVAASGGAPPGRGSPKLN